MRLSVVVATGVLVGALGEPAPAITPVAATPVAVISSTPPAAPADELADPVLPTSTPLATTPPASAAPTRAPLPVATARVVAAAAASRGSVVVASWYGPGFYGNRTACGQTYSPVILGVAHRSLPCGSVVRLAHGSLELVLPVIDRGPFVGGREFDLSAAARAALECPDLCRVRWIA